MLTDWLFWGTGIALGIAGLGLLYRSLLADRSRGRRRCPKCWYDMSGTDSFRCPECGREVKSERQLLKTRRRWRYFAVGLAVLIAALVCAGRPLLRDQRWHQLIPTPVLIRMVGTLQSGWALDVLATRLGVMQQLGAEDYEYGNAFRPIHEQYMGTPRNLVLTPMDDDDWHSLRRALLQVLTESDDTTLIEKSLVGLGTYGLIDESCGATLVDLLDHPNQDVRRLAAAGLCYEPVRASLCKPETQKRLRTLIDSSKLYTVFVGLRAMSLCDMDDDTIRAAFEHAMNADNSDIRMCACSVLDRYCASPETAFDLLTGMADDPSPGVRERTMRAMASLHSRGIDTLPNVLSFADDPTPSVRSSVIITIAESLLDEQSAIDVLLGFVGDKDQDVRWTLVFAAENLTTDHDIAKRILKPLCDDASDAVRQDARKALAKLEGGT